MPRFFTDAPASDFITVTGSDARHIGYSLRMKIGEEVTFCHSGTDYNCVIESITESEVLCRVVEAVPSKSEPSVQVTLYQAYPKQDKLELIIQKTTELGVTRIVPFISSRCIARPDEKSYRKKQERMQKIAEEAAKQSGRGIIPEISPMVSYKQCLEMMKELDKTIMLYEGEGGKPFGDVAVEGIKTAGLLIGSEGGFDVAEVEDAVSAGAERVWLGKRILRCETAPISALSILMFLTKNM